MYIYMQKEKEILIYSKELVHVIMEAWQIQILQSRPAG